MDRLGVTSTEVADSALALVQAAYCVPPRAYHDLTHISACLTLLDEIANTFAQPLAAEFALWLHDAIYDPARPDNEQRSAAAARILGTGMGVEPATLAAVELMILATRHINLAPTQDAALVADIDLAILAAAPAEYEHYSRAIRAEYAAYDDASYAAGRAKFIQSMLSRDPIFQTALFRDRCEESARRNLSNEATRLSS